MWWTMSTSSTWTTVTCDYEYTIPFDELAGLTDEDYLERIAAFEGDGEES